MLKFLYLLICFALPNVIWQLQNKQRLMRRKKPVRHLILTYIFWLYCALVIHVAGIGTIWEIFSYKKILGGFSFIPFASAKFTVYLLNMVMLIPLGFLLPFIWKEFRKLRYVCFLGLGFSLLIEFFQIFGHNVSDITDLLMNTLGTCVGYFLWLAYCRFFSIRSKAPDGKKKTSVFNKTEPMKYILLGILGIFLLYNWQLLDTALVSRPQGDDTSIHDAANREAREDFIKEIDGPSDVAIIVRNDGVVERKNCNDLLNFYHKDPDAFRELYEDAKITFADIPRVSEVNSLDEDKLYRSLIFAHGWHVVFAYEGYEFIDQAEEEGREIFVLVDSFISGVWKYDSNMYMIALGSVDESSIDQTTITELE